MAVNNGAPCVLGALTDSALCPLCDVTGSGDILYTFRITAAAPRFEAIPFGNPCMLIVIVPPLVIFVLERVTCGILLMRTPVCWGCERWLLCRVADPVGVAVARTVAGTLLPSSGVGVTLGLAIDVPIAELGPVTSPAGVVGVGVEGILGSTADDSTGVAVAAIPIAGVGGSGVAVAMDVALGVALGGAGVGVAVATGATLGVALGGSLIGVEVAVGVPVAVGVSVTVGVSVAAGVSVAVGVLPLGVAVAVGDGEVPTINTEKV